MNTLNLNIPELIEDVDVETLLEPPYKVLIHNDDSTPYEFVVGILRNIFALSPAEAELVTFAAHTTGIALVCVLPLSEAKARVGKAHFAASLEGYPLHFSIEPE